MLLELEKVAKDSPATAVSIFIHVTAQLDSRSSAYYDEKNEKNDVISYHYERPAVRKIVRSASEEHRSVGVAGVFASFSFDHAGLTGGSVWP